MTRLPVSTSRGEHSLVHQCQRESQGNSSEKKTRSCAEAEINEKFLARTPTVFLLRLTIVRFFQLKDCRPTPLPQLPHPANTTALAAFMRIISSPAKLVLQV